MSTCTLLAAVPVAQTRTAEAKVYKGAEVYSHPESDSGCAIGGSQPRGIGGLWATLLALGLAAGRRRARQLLRWPRPLAVSKPRLTLVALLVGVLAPAAASATQSAELYRTQAYFYGRFEARVRYAPGEGVVSSFFLWKDGSSSTTSWNELDYEKVNSTCRLTTNIWTGTGTQSSQTNTPTFDVCADYHTYAFEWTPDYIAWFIDGTQVRRVTGASVTEYTRNASQGMTIHFNVWAGDASFGGTLNPSTLPVRQYISWVQYSSYANGAFQMQWREEFDGSTMPSGWMKGNWSSPFNLSTHNTANVSFVNGIAVLSLTADNATGFTGTPPADTAGGGGASGTGGRGGAGGSGGTAGSGTGGAGTGSAGRGGAGGTSAGGGRGGTAGSSSAGSGGTSSTGSGGTGAVGTAGNGAGGTSTGAAGNGAGGVAAGAAGNGAGGMAGGAAGSGTGGPSGSGGAVGTGGASATGGGGATATGGTSGNGATGGAGDSTGSGDGCSCRAGGDRPPAGEGLIAILLIAACVLARRPRITRRPSH